VQIKEEWGEKTILREMKSRHCKREGEVPDDRWALGKRNPARGVYFGDEEKDCRGKNQRRRLTYEEGKGRARGEGIESGGPRGG